MACPYMVLVATHGIGIHLAPHRAVICDHLLLSVLCALIRKFRQGALSEIKVVPRPSLIVP